MILPHPEPSSSPATPGSARGSLAARSSREAAPRPASADRLELTSLVTRAQAGESAAQTELLRSYHRRITGYIRLIIRQPDAEEDVVQMVFIKVFRRLARLRDPASFESWLFRMARNTAVDFIRRRSCRPSTVPVELETHDLADPADANATSEIMDALDAALAQVSPTDRQLVTLFVEGNSYQSLARKNGLTLGAVKARLHRMRPFLRSFVGEALESRTPAIERWSIAPRVHLAA